MISKSLIEWKLLAMNNGWIQRSLQSSGIEFHCVRKRSSKSVWPCALVDAVMKFINLINEDQVQILLSVASYASLRPLTRFAKGVSIFSPPQRSLKFLEIAYVDQLILLACITVIHFFFRRKNFNFRSSFTFLFLIYLRPIFTCWNSVFPMQFQITR